jgi:hypothetical protein
VWLKYGSPVWEVVREQSQKAATVIRAWALNLGNWCMETWPVVANFVSIFCVAFSFDRQQNSI